MGISFLGWVFFRFMADVLLLSAKMLLFGADRVVGTCGAAWNSLFVPRKLLSSHHDVIIPREVTLIGRGFRVAVPKSSRQYLSVCRRDFPIQGDVAPKVWNCSKTFMRIPSVGSVLFVLPTEGIFIYLS